MNPDTGIRPRERMDGEKDGTALVHCRYRYRIPKLYDPHVRKNIIDDVSQLPTWTPKIHIADDDAEKEE